MLIENELLAGVRAGPDSSDSHEHQHPSAPENPRPDAALLWSDRRHWRPLRRRSRWRRRRHLPRAISDGWLWRCFARLGILHRRARVERRRRRARAHQWRTVVQTNTKSVVSVRTITLRAALHSLTSIRDWCCGSTPLAGR